MSKDKKPSGYWKSLDNVINEIRGIMKKHGLKSCPSQKNLYGLGYNFIAKSIINYHSGFRNLRVAMREKQKKVENGAWEKFEFVLEKAKEIMAEFGGDTLPSFNKLRRAGHSSFVYAISTFHGGMSKFRRKIKDKYVRVSRGEWKSLDYCIEKAKDVLLEVGFDRLPRGKILNKLGYSSLTSAIHKYHGGFPAFREKLREYLGLPSEKNQLESLLESYVSGGEQHG